jgi:Rrf2 family protein
MKITSQEEYGLRCLVQIARQRMDEDPDQPLPISEIARAEGISVEYAGKLLSLLRQGELVRSVRGKHGGYVLNRDAAGITLLDVVTALSGPIFRNDTCSRFSGQAQDCVHIDNCGMRPVWAALSSIIGSLLDSITIADLCREEHEVARSILTEPWRHLGQLADAVEPPRLSARSGTRSQTTATG